MKVLESYAHYYVYQEATPCIGRETCFPMNLQLCNVHVSFQLYFILMEDVNNIYYKSLIIYGTKTNFHSIDGIEQILS